METVAGDRISCQLLVGADGNRSQCRQHVQPDAQLEYVGACVWRFFFEEENPFAEDGEAVVLTGDGRVRVSPSLGLSLTMSTSMLFCPVSCPRVVV